MTKNEIMALCIGLFTGIPSIIILSHYFFGTKGFIISTILFVCAVIGASIGSEVIDDYKKDGKLK